MKLISVLLLAGLLSATSAQAEQSAQESAQDAGKAIANQGKRATPVSGSTEASSILSTSTALSYGGVPTASKTNTSVLSRTIPAILKCLTTATPYYAGNLGLRTTGCSKTPDGTITMLKIDVCGQSLMGGDCTEQTWIGIPYYIGPSTGAPNYYTTTTPQFGIRFLFTGFCDKVGCPVNIQVESYLSVSGSSLQQAGVTAQTQGDNTLAQQAEIVGNTRYITQLNQTSGQFKSCQDAIQNAAKAGQVFTTCDGQDTAYVGGGCAETSKCVSYRTQTREWLEKCQTEVPTVRRDCNTLTPTRICTSIKPQQECTYEMATQTCPIGTCSIGFMQSKGYIKIASDATTDYFAQAIAFGKSSCSAPIPTVPELVAPYGACSGWDGTIRCDQYYMGYCIKVVEPRTCPKFSKTTCTDPAFPACVNSYAAPILGVAATTLSAPRCPAALNSSADTASCKVAGTPVCKRYIGNLCVEETQRQYCPGLAQTTCFSPTPPLVQVGGSAAVCKAIPEASGCRDKFVWDPVTQTNIPTDPRIAPADSSIGGICLNNWTSEGCYAGKPEICIQAKPTIETTQNCVLSKQTCVTEVLGVCGTVEQEYKCSETRSNCSAYRKDTTCNGSLTQGTEVQAAAPVGDSFAKAAAAMGVVEGIQKSQTQKLSIFNGDPLTCKKPTWILNLDSYLANDCCRRDLEKTNPGKPLHKCSEDAVSLAAGRRANRTYPLGDYCSNKKPWPFGCQERAQVDCVFPSLLAKNIQVGGRKQLLELSSGGSNTPQVSTTRFTYYAAAGAPGTWVTLGQVGGRAIHAYQWPAYCATAELETAYMKANPNALVCNSGLKTYFAVCNNSEICTLVDKVPTDPRVGATDWTINGLDPLVDATTSLTPDVAVKGSCSPSDGWCNYTVSTWSRGGLSMAYAQADLTFEVGAGLIDNTITVGNFQFYPQWLNTDVSSWYLYYLNNTNAQPQWKALSLGLDIPGPGLTLPQSNGIQVYGSCSLATRVCRFTLRVPVSIKPKPWGTAESPKCGGFTPEELSVLDFSKIDLSEFVATVKASAPTQAEVQTMASNSLAATTTLQKFGGSKADRDGSAVHILQIVPEEVSGCFKDTEPNCTRGRVRISIPANWPGWTPEARNDINLRDIVIQATVNWGDGRSTTNMTRALNSDTLTAEHSYWEQGGNVQHEISISMSTTKSGPQWVTGIINNFTKNPSKGAGIGLNPTGQFRTSYAPRMVTPSNNTSSGVSGNIIPVPKPGP